MQSKGNTTGCSVLTAAAARRRARRRAARRPTQQRASTTTTSTTSARPSTSSSTACSRALRSCTEKASPLTYAEAHAGRGLYPFDSEEAATLSEFVDGYHKLRAARRVGSFMRISRHISRRSCRTGVGSAALAALALREGDRGIFFERDSVCAAALTDALMRLGADFTVEARDGHAGTRQLRISTRGLVFVDPPYQSGSDTDLIAALCGHLKKYWRAARIGVWYPRGDSMTHLWNGRRRLAAVGSSTCSTRT